MAEVVVHFQHFFDGCPLCWTLDQVAYEPLDGVKRTSVETDVTCPRCLAYLAQFAL